MSKMLTKIDRFCVSLCDLIPNTWVALMMRASIFFVFWDSAQAKIAGSYLLGQKWQFWKVSDSTLMLFDYEYALPLIPANIAAYVATFGEFFLALAVLLGLLTRLSALGLLVMVVVIQIFVYPGIWKEHILWAAILLYLMKNGAGGISVDYLLRRK